ncbi:hypothetical protein D035_2293 [Vibrio parahaemolyticus VP250]|nr:hypothetical protein D035_2293 [Vibrio parahaemolyticus VP250]
MEEDAILPVYLLTPVLGTLKYQESYKCALIVLVFALDDVSGELFE